MGLQGMGSETDGGRRLQETAHGAADQGAERRKGDYPKEVMKVKDRINKAIIAILAMLVIGLAILNLTYDDRIEPDCEFPMANQHIEWAI